MVEYIIENDLTYSLSSINTIEETYSSYNENSVPLFEDNGQYYIDVQDLYKHMDRTREEDVSSAISKILSVNKITKSCSIMVDKDNIYDIEECLNIIEAAKANNIKLVKVNENTERKIAKIDRDIKKVDANIAKLQEKKKWWNTLSVEEQQKQANIRIAIRVVQKVVTVTLTHLITKGYTEFVTSSIQRPINLADKLLLAGVAVPINVSSNIIADLVNPNKIVTNPSQQNKYYEDAIMVLKHTKNFLIRKKKSLISKK